MKITFVLNSIGLYGGVRVVFEYADRLQKRNHQVQLVYPAVDLDYLKTLSFLAFGLWVVISIVEYLRNVIGGDRSQRFATGSTVKRIPVIYPRFASSLEKLVPDADVIVATAWKTSFFVSRLSSQKGHKFYFIQHYEIWDVWEDTECWKEAKRINKGKEAFGLAMADVMPTKKGLRESKEAVDHSYKLPLRKITIAEWLRHLIEDKFGEHIYGVIPNGVNFDIFFKEGNRREEAEHINVLMPYRPMAWKGFDDGLDAFGQIKTRYPNTHFAVFGRPVNSGEVRKLPEWIEFYDDPSDAQLRELYNETHIFVLPSWIEGFPLPPMEAMACGCALVTTETGGFADYLTNGENAFLVPIQEPDALAQSVCRLIDDANERRRMAQNGYEFVKRFTWEDATTRLEAILTKS
jgi:glycosyltransferase involved in cell wall biosynthesis